MSIYKSYLNKSNTLIQNSYTNTSRNPIVELFYGRVDNLSAPIGFSRFIFDINLSNLQSNISEKIITSGCGTNYSHTFRMTNTSYFDEELINSTTSQGRRRATSFDLILFRIPKTSGTTGSPQLWDSGSGYDYYDYKVSNLNDRSFSHRPSNWYERTTISGWSVNGIYDNKNSQSGATASLNYSALTIVDTQHFEFGNEDIEFNMTNEINGILNGTITGGTGWGVAFYPQVENISGMTENYSVGFFSPNTQTFYEPFLETNYNDLIIDDRNKFYSGNNNELYLYVYENGNAVNLDNLPTVDIFNSNNVAVSGFTGLSTCQVTKGVYKCSINNLTASTVPCLFYDVWKGLSVSSTSISNVTLEFALLPKNGNFQIGSVTQQPKIYGFSFDGIRQNEKVLNTDIRKVNVTIKQAYSTNTPLTTIESYYRIYVREGLTTEVQVQDWTRINESPDGFYFIFDTTDKIPNEYFVDIKVVSDRNIDTHKRELQFQIVNKK